MRLGGVAGQNGFGHHARVAVRQSRMRHQTRDAASAGKDPLDRHNRDCTEIGFKPPVGEKRRIDACRIKTRHGPDIKTQRTRSQHQITALQ